MRPIIPDTLNLLHWIPWSNLTESSSIGDLYLSIRFILSEFHDKICLAVSAAKRPAAFRSKGAPEAASEDTIVICAQRCLPVLLQIFRRSYKDHGNLINGHALQSPESIWSGFGSEEQVRIHHHSHCGMSTISIHACVFKM